MATEYKLTYFALFGRAEPLRMMFSAAGVKYEEHNFQLRMELTETSREINQEDGMTWHMAKPNYIFGYLPVLDIKTADGHTAQLCELSALMRYLARKFDMYGDGEIEMAEVDMYGELINKVGNIRIPDWVWIPDQEAKKAAKPKLDEEILTMYGHFEKKLEKSESGFVVGSRLSSVDIGLFVGLEGIVAGVRGSWVNMQETVLEKYPHVKRHFEFMKTIPRIAEHLQNRPNYLY